MMTTMSSTIVVDRAGDMGAALEVARLVDGVLGAGEHTVVWDGTRADGSQAAAGVYFLRLAAAGRELSAKSVLVR